MWTTVDRNKTKRIKSKSLAKLGIHETLQNIDEPHIYFLKQIRSAGTVRQAMLMLQEMKNASLTRDISHFNAAIAVCAENKQWKIALSLLEGIKRSHLQPEVVTYNSVINACAKARQWQRAVSVLNEMEHRRLKPNIITYTAVLVVCQENNQWGHSELILARMTRQGIAPDSTTYNAVMNCRGQKWQKALLLLDEMKRMDISPTLKTYHAIVQTCTKGGKWKLALGLLHEAHVQPRIQPDLILYSTVIRACSNAGQWKTVLALFGEMQQCGIIPDIVSYNQTFQEACEKSGRWELLKSTREGPIVTPDQMSYNIALQVFCETRLDWRSVRLPVRIAPIAREDGVITCDLHGMTLATACMLVSDILIAWSRQSRTNQRDVYIITGKGVHSDAETGPMLRHGVQSFLRNNSGPKTVGDGHGSFIVKKGSLLKWIKSNDFFSFRILVSLPQSFLLTEPKERRHCNVRSWSKVTK